MKFCEQSSPVHRHSAAAHAPEQIILYEKIVLYDKNENNSEIPGIINGVCKKFQGASCDSALKLHGASVKTL